MRYNIIKLDVGTQKSCVPTVVPPMNGNLYTHNVNRLINSKELILNLLYLLIRHQPLPVLGAFPNS